MIPFKTDLTSYTKETLNNWTYIHCDFHLHIYEDSIQEFKIRLENNNQYITIQDYDFLHKLDNFIKGGLFSEVIIYGNHISLWFGISWGCAQIENTFISKLLNQTFVSFF